MKKSKKANAQKSKVRKPKSGKPKSQRAKNRQQGPSSQSTRWFERIRENVALGETEEVLAADLLEKTIAEMNGLPAKIYAGDDYLMVGVRSLAYSSLAGIHSVRGDFESALRVLASDPALEGVTPSTQHELDMAFLLHQLGRTQESVERILALLGRDDVFDSWQAHDAFLALLRYGQTDAAERWLKDVRNPATAPAHWRQPNAIGLLYRLEASLRLEVGDYEAALTSYRKSVSLMGYTIGDCALAQDFIAVGRPEFAARILGGERELFEQQFWHGVALRALGRTDEARAELDGLSLDDADDLTQPELDLYAALSSAYLGEDQAELVDTLITMFEEGEEFDQSLGFALAVATANSAQYGLEFENGLRIGQREARRNFQGNAMDRTLWYHAKQLFPPDRLAVAAPYFEPTLLPMHEF